MTAEHDNAQLIDSVQSSDRARLEAEFAANKYAAVAIDTNNFDRNGKRLDGRFALVKQFTEAGIILLFPDVIVGEITEHLRQRYRTEEDRQSAAVLTLSKSLPEPLLENIKAELEGKKRDPEADVRAFLEQTSSSVLKAQQYASIDAVMSDYFATRPPFEASGIKKSEFPDALALKTLEGWASERKLQVLCISDDKGWAEYCERSERLSVSSDYMGALEACVAAHQARTQVTKAAFLQLAQTPEGKESLSQGVEHSLDNIFFSIEATSNYFYDYEVVATELVSTDLAERSPEARLVSIVSGSAVFEVTCEVVINVTVAFTFSTWDSIDREHVSIGSNSIEQEVHVETSLLVHVHVDELLSGDSQSLTADEIETIEFADQRLDADFGEVDPDWGDPEL